jgi:hypothetical protein
MKMILKLFKFHLEGKIKYLDDVNIFQYFWHMEQTKGRMDSNPHLKRSKVDLDPLIKQVYKIAYQNN